jgi:hypothetical protein
LTLTELGPFEVSFVPNRFYHLRRCVEVEGYPKYVSCYLCPPCQCPHKVGARSNLVWALINRPDDYPDWVHEALSGDVDRVVSAGRPRRMVSQV